MTSQSFVMFGVVLRELAPDPSARRFEAAYSGQRWLLSIPAIEDAQFGPAEALKRAVAELKQGRRGVVFPS